MTRALRILFVTTEAPWPLNHGGRLHVHHVVRELAERATVTLAFPGQAVALPEMPAEVTIRPIVSDAGPAPLPRGASAAAVRRHFGWRRDMAAFIHATAHPAHTDVVVLHGGVLGQYAALCRVPVLWNLQDELVLPLLRGWTTTPWTRWPRLARNAALYAAYERAIARRAAATVLVSPVDASYLQRWGGGAATVTDIPNGVDTDYFSAADTPGRPGTVVFAGALDFPPNVHGALWFLRHVWPQVHQADATRRLMLVGRRPATEVRTAALSAVNVELHADVPDVRPYLRQAAVVVVPVWLGGGLKNKVLEGCALRRAVLTTPTACVGAGARPGRDVLTAGARQTWVIKLDRLLSNPRGTARLAERGWRWVRTHRRWHQTGQAFAELLYSIASHSQPAAGGRRQRSTTLVAQQHVRSTWAKQGVRGREVACP